MPVAEIVIGIILIVFAVFLIVAVLMQQGKAHNLSGTIAGGAETFFVKSKGQTISKKLSILTTTVSIIFVLLVVSIYVMQDTGSASSFKDVWNALLGRNESIVATVDDDETTAADDHDHDHADEADETTAADADETTAAAAE